MTEAAQLNSDLVIHYQRAHFFYWTYFDIKLAPSDVDIVLDPSEIWNKRPAGVLGHFHHALEGQVGNRDATTNRHSMGWAPYEFKTNNTNLPDQGYVKTPFTNINDATLWSPTPRLNVDGSQTETLSGALSRVAEIKGTTELRMISYRQNIASATVLIHRIERITHFSDGGVENKLDDIGHIDWVELMASLEESSPLIVLQELDKLRRRVDFDSYFSVLRWLIREGQHGVDEDQVVEPRVFEHLQSIRADLLGRSKWDGLFQPAELAIENETTKVDNKGCIACYDDFTSGPHGGETGPPYRLMCGCEGAYCHRCLRKWITENARCTLCKKPFLLSTRLEWVRKRNQCGLPDEEPDDEEDESIPEVEPLPPPFMGEVEDIEERSLSMG